MPSSSLEEMMAELDKLSELERLVATLPSSPPPSPSRNSRGLSFSVAGIGLGTTTATTSGSGISSSEPWENRMPSDLMDTTLSLDFGVVGSAAGVSLPVSAASNAEPGEGRGRLLVHYVGGSVTFLLKIAVLAWSVRLLRRVWARHRSTSVAVESPPFSAISCAALRKLAELDSLDFVVVDVRDADSVSANPVSLKNLVNIPESELTTCLQLKDNAWITRFSPTKKPVAADVLVFLSTRGQRAERAAVAAAELGFNRCCVVSGGIQALVASETEDASCGVKYLGRFGYLSDCLLIQIRSKRCLKGRSTWQTFEGTKRGRFMATFLARCTFQRRTGQKLWPWPPVTGKRSTVFQSLSRTLLLSYTVESANVLCGLLNFVRISD